MHLPVQANDGIGFGMHPGYWRTWITGVNWHSSARMTETNPTSRNIMTGRSGKKLLLWFLLTVVCCLDVDGAAWCVKDDILSCVHVRSLFVCLKKTPDFNLVRRSNDSKCPTAGQSNIGVRPTVPCHVQKVFFFIIIFSRQLTWLLTPHHKQWLYLFLKKKFNDMCNQCSLLWCYWTISAPRERHGSRFFLF